jgi:hypothetical protein
VTPTIFCKGKARQVDLIDRAKSYLAANAAESGADMLIQDLVAELERVERNMHTAMQAARGEEKEECARMAREYARAVSKGTFPKPASAEGWGEAIAKHIEIPF